ncbi:MAG: peroxiredoxin family protein [Nitritalea sp.]
MKTKILKSLLFLLLVLIGCKPSTSEEYYLQKVVDHLSQIKSVSYYLETISSAPGDTTKFTEPRSSYHRIFVHPADTLVGSSSATFLAEDTTRMTDFYDGAVRGKVNWDKQYVKVDSFGNNPHPFRLVHYPFYTRINEILKYTLTTEDSIQTDFKDYGDSVYFSLRIINKHVYFHINPIVIENEYIPEDEVSQFDIWFSKKDGIPYRMRSKWHHVTLFESAKQADFNFTKDTVFRAEKCFPSYFTLQHVDPYAVKSEVQVEDEGGLLGKIAPDWVLQGTDLNYVHLGDLKSKVLLIQFTGIGCGPCHFSVPFLKNLVEEYRSKDFEFLSLETWSNNMEGLKRYQQQNELNFKFLNSTAEVNASYGIPSVPIFFILDEDRVVRKIIKGYSKGHTDKEIKESINLIL